jgi:hypothetical protein
VEGSSASRLRVMFSVGTGKLCNGFPSLAAWPGSSLAFLEFSSFKQEGVAAAVVVACIDEAFVVKR